MNAMQPSRVARWSVATGLVALAVAAGYAVLESPDAAPQLPVLHASTPGGPDSDGDGLPDLVELRLGTSLDRADSDGDGYWDAEEVARQSNPVNKKSIPVSIPASVGMGIYEKNSTLHPVVAIYIADGDIRSASLKLGLRVNTLMRDMPIGYFSKGATLKNTPTFNAQSKVLVYDLTMPASHVKRFGDLSVYSKVDYRGSIISADALNLWTSGGVIVESQITGYHTPAQQPSLATLNVGQGSTGVYTPLGGSSTSAPAPAWQSGMVCAQSMVVVGVVGSVVVQEVVGADCEAGWESYCDAGCAATVGQTVNMVDPVALVGG